MEETNESGYSEWRKHTLTANELRIGNLLNLYGQTVTVVGIDRTLHGEYHVTYNDGEKEYRTARYLDQFEPIPLNEEWLVKFGFEKQENTSWVIGTFIIWDDLKFGNKLIYQSKCFYYVHQLQNLYYSLCGKELTV